MTNLSPAQLQTLRLLAESCLQGNANSLAALQRRGLVRLTRTQGVNPYSKKVHTGIDSAELTAKGVAECVTRGINLHPWWS